MNLRCRNGHPVTPDNVRHRTGKRAGQTECLTCYREAAARRGRAGRPTDQWQNRARKVRKRATRLGMTVAAAGGIRPSARPVRPPPVRPGTVRSLRARDSRLRRPARPAAAAAGRFLGRVRCAVRHRTAGGQAQAKQHQPSRQSSDDVGAFAALADTDDRHPGGSDGLSQRTL